MGEAGVARLKRGLSEAQKRIYATAPAISQHEEMAKNQSNNSNSTRTHPKPSGYGFSPSGRSVNCLGLPSAAIRDHPVPINTPGPS